MASGLCVAPGPLLHCGAVLTRPPDRKRGAPRAWPKSVRNREEFLPPRSSSRPVTSCSPISSAAASWKRRPSTRRSGLTIPCCTSPTATRSCAKGRSPSCGSWASDTAGPSSRGQPPSAPAPDARRSFPGAPTGARVVSATMPETDATATPTRRAIPHSTPETVERAATTVAPAPTSSTLNGRPPPWATAAGGVTNRRSASNAAVPGTLEDGDVVGNADVGGEGGDHGAILLEREVDRPARLDVVGAAARHAPAEMDGGIAARLRVAAGAPPRAPPRAPRPPPPLQDQHHGAPRAAGRGQEEEPA